MQRTTHRLPHRHLIGRAPWLWGAEDGGEGTEGSEGDAGKAGTSNGGEGGSGGEAKGSRTLTDDELEKITARAADRAGRGAMKALAEELGFDSTSKLKEYVTERKKAQEAAKTAEQKAEDARKAATASAETQSAELREDRLMLAIERAVVAEGVGDPKKSKRLAAMLRTELTREDIDLDDEGGWTSAIEAAVSTVKTDSPEFFRGAKTDHGGGDVTSGGPSKPDAKPGETFAKEYEAKGLVQRPA